MPASDTTAPRTRLLFQETPLRLDDSSSAISNLPACSPQSSLRERKCCLCVNGTSAEKEEIPQFHRILALHSPHGGIHSNTTPNLPPGTLPPYGSPVYTPLWFRSERPGQVCQEMALTSTWVFSSLEASSFLFLSSFLLFPAPSHRNWRGHKCLFLLWAVYLALNAFKIISQQLGLYLEYVQVSLLSIRCLLFYSGIWTIAFLISEPT